MNRVLASEQTTRFFVEGAASGKKGGLQVNQSKDPAGLPFVRSRDLAWIPTGPGKSFKPLYFKNDGWSELMRIEPGGTVALHRHTGELHSFTLRGTRRFGTGEVYVDGDYVHEPSGTVDTWTAIGDTACIVHLSVTGAIEYVDEHGSVLETVDAATQRRVYLEWCEAHGLEPTIPVIG